MPTATLQDRLSARGLSGARRPAYRTVAGMVAVIIAVLAGATVALLIAVVSSHSLARSLIAAGIVALVTLLGLMEYQHRAWIGSQSD
jgi:hypothetical protein